MNNVIYSSLAAAALVAGLAVINSAPASSFPGTARGMSGIAQAEGFGTTTRAAAPRGFTVSAADIVVEGEGRLRNPRGPTPAR